MCEARRRQLEFRVGDHQANHRPHLRTAFDENFGDGYGESWADWKKRLNKLDKAPGQLESKSRNFELGQQSLQFRVGELEDELEELRSVHQVGREQNPGSPRRVKLKQKSNLLKMIKCH